MKKKRLPWVKFYYIDWRGDDPLRRCSLAARGAWHETLCLMWGDGVYALKNTLAGWAEWWGCTPEEAAKIIAEYATHEPCDMRPVVRPKGAQKSVTKSVTVTLLLRACNATAVGSCYAPITLISRRLKSNSKYREQARIRMQRSRLKKRGEPDVTLQTTGPVTHDVTGRDQRPETRDQIETTRKSAPHKGRAPAQPREVPSGGCSMSPPTPLDPDNGELARLLRPPLKRLALAARVPLGVVARLVGEGGPGSLRTTLAWLIVTDRDVRNPARGIRCPAAWFTALCRCGKSPPVDDYEAAKDALLLDSDTLDLAPGVREVVAGLAAKMAVPDVDDEFREAQKRVLAEIQAGAGVDGARQGVG